MNSKGTENMAYRIRGLDRSPFEHLFALDDAALAAHRARRVTADSDRGFPCRISLEDARKGERLLLVHHVHNEVETPYRSGFAVFIRESAGVAAEYIEACPPVFAGRTLALRGFSRQGDLAEARLVEGEAADGAIRAMFADARIAYINAHNAAHGCFAARIERHGEPA
jgi:hypothetical protein